MKILFLDQNNKFEEAELYLLNIAKPYRDRSLVSLFYNANFRHLLEQQFPVEVLSDRAIVVRKDSSFIQRVASLSQFRLLILQMAQLSHCCAMIYASIRKALVVGAIADCLVKLLKPPQRLLPLTVSATSMPTLNSTSNIASQFHIVLLGKLL